MESNPFLFIRRNDSSPVLGVQIVIIHDGHAIEVAIPSICKPEDTSHVVISRETERSVNQIDDHKEEVGSSTQLLGDLQESEKVTTSSKENCAVTGTKKLDADSISLIPKKASLYTGPINVPARVAAKTLVFGEDRDFEYSRRRVPVLHPSSSSGRSFQRNVKLSQDVGRKLI